MIQNARVFQEDHIPRKVPHRNTEKNQLSRAIKPIEEGEPGGKATFLFGPSGTGKTQYLTKPVGINTIRLTVRQTSD